MSILVFWLQRRVDVYEDTAVTEEHTASICLEMVRVHTYVPSKSWYIPVSPHGLTSQKTNMASTPP